MVVQLVFVAGVVVVLWWWCDGSGVGFIHGRYVYVVVGLD